MLRWQRPHRRRQTDRQTGTGKRRGSHREAAWLPQCSTSPGMHHCHGKGCDSRQLSHCPAAGWKGASPRLLFPNPHRPAQPLQGTVPKPALAEDSGPKAVQPCSLPPASHHSLPYPQGLGRGTRNKHGKSRTITPELLPVAPRANAPPSTALGCGGTAHTLPGTLQLGASGSELPAAASTWTRKQTSTGQWLLHKDRWELGPGSSLKSRGSFTDRTLVTQHTSALKRRTPRSYRIDLPLQSHATISHLACPELQ